MAETKTKPSEIDPATFIGSIEPAAKRADAEALAALFARVSGRTPRIWGPSIIGYGSYHYRYASGHEGRAPRIAFSPRKARHSLYLIGCDGKDATDEFEALLDRLGKHQRSVACLYVNKLADIDLAVLEDMAALSWKQSFVDWPDD